MKNGDYVIAPVGCAEYLTAGKKYQIFDVDEGGFYIHDDMSTKSYCVLNGCEHLNGQNWILATESEAFLKEVDGSTKPILGENLTMGSDSFYVKCSSDEIFANISSRCSESTYRLNVDEVDADKQNPIGDFLLKNGFEFIEKGLYLNEKAKVIIYDDYYAVLNLEDNGINYSDNLNIYWLIGYLTYYDLIDKNYKI